MAQAITVELSETLFDQLKQTADFTHHPVERLVTQSLAQTITPFFEDIPAEYQRDVYPLLAMTEDELFAQTQALFPVEQWAEYETLLMQQKEQPLNSDEQQRLTWLRRQADLLMLRKGYAALLLKRRGQRPPTLDELPPVSYHSQ